MDRPSPFFPGARPSGSNFLNRTEELTVSTVRKSLESQK